MPTTTIVCSVVLADPPDFDIPPTDTVSSEVLVNSIANGRLDIMC